MAVPAGCRCPCLLARPRGTQRRAGRREQPPAV